MTKSNNRRNKCKGNNNQKVMQINNDEDEDVEYEEIEVEEEIEQDDNDNDNEKKNNNQFNEDSNFDTADEMDPDLFAEINREKESQNRDEDQQRLKEGAEFLTKLGDGPFKAELEMQATEFSACKPWMGVVLHSIPSDYKPSKLDTAAPDSTLELEYVHGYRCHDTRNNLRYTVNGDIVYHTAAVGIVFNKENRSQRFFFDHIDDITALAIHPDKKIVATGEMGPHPLIAVWDTETGTCLARMNGPLQKGINTLSFSRDGKYLVATAANDDHDVAVFDWSKGSATSVENLKPKQKAAIPTPVVATGKGPRANIMGSCFNAKGDTVALMCVREVNFVTFAGNKYAIKRGTGLRNENMTTIMCGVYINNTLVTGSFKGDLLLFNGPAFTKQVKAHTSCVNCLELRPNNTGFLSGGNDGMVLVWDNKMAITHKLSILGTDIKSLCPKVRSVCEDENNNYLIGSRGGEIIEFVDNSPNVLMRGHFDLELWALSIHPKQNKYFTAGQDKMLALWNIETRDIEKVK
jgi:microtubule-associated protein-like 6